MATDIGAVLALDGVSQFKQAMQTSAQITKQFNEELRGITSTFSSAGASEDQLAAKNKTLAASIQNSKNTMSVLGGELNKQTAELDRLKAAMNQANAEYGENSAEAQKAQQAYAKQQVTVSKLETQYSKAERQVNEMTSQMQKNETAIEDVKRGYDDAGNKVDEFGNIIDNAGNKGSIGLGKIAAGLGVFKLIEKGVSAIKNSFGDAFDRLDTFSKFERTMSEFTGSTETAKNALNNLDEAMTGTAYSLDQGASSVQNLTTAGMDINKATDQVAIWGDAVSFYSDGSSESLKQVTDALSKMTSKGKVNMGQLNQIIVENGIPAVKMYAESVGMSAADVQKGLSNGEISAEQFITTVSQAMKDGTDSFTAIEGAAKEAEGQYSTTFANMKTAVTRGVANAIYALDEGMQKADLGSITENVSRVTKEINKGFEKVAIAIPPIISALKTLAPVISVVSGALLGMRTAFAINNSIIKTADNFGKLKKSLSKVIPKFEAKTAAVSTDTVATSTNTITNEANKRSLSNITKGFANATKKILAKTGALIASTTMTIGNTAALGLSAIAHSRLSGAIGRSISKIIAFTVANRAALIASLGVLAPIIAMGVYMSKTGTSAEEMGAKIEGFTEKIVAGIEGFSEKLPSIIDSVTNSMVTIIDSVVAVLPTLIPALVGAGLTMFMALVDTLPQILTPLIQGLITLITAFVGLIPTLVPPLINAGLQLFMALVGAIPLILPPLIQGLITLITAIVGVIPILIPPLINAGIQLFMTLVNAITLILPPLIAMLPTIIMAIVDTLISNLPILIEGAVTLFMAILEAIPVIIAALIPQMPKIIAAIVVGLISAIGKIFKVGIKLLKELWRGINNKVGWIKGKVVSFAKSIPDKVTEGLKEIGNVGKNLIMGLWNGINDKVEWIRKKIEGFGESVMNAIKGFFGIKSPSREMAWVGKMLGVGFGGGLFSALEGVRKNIRPEMDNILNEFSKVPDIEPNVNAVPRVESQTIVQDILSGVATLMASNKNQSGDIVINLDGKTIARSTLDHIAGINKQAGVVTTVG